MDIESVRDYCLSLPMTSEDMAFGDDLILVRVCEKIFAAIALDGSNKIVMKCDENYAVELRDHYLEIEPAFHWNKKYWNQVYLNGSLKSDFIKKLIRHSYAQVIDKLTLKVKRAYPEILSIKE